MKQNLLTSLLVLFSLALFSQGETCATAELISTNGTYNADGPSSGGGCLLCDGSTHSDWYTFSSPQVGILNVSSCQLFGEDTRVYLYKGNCTGMQLIASDDEGCGFQSGSLLFNVLTEANSTYYLEWDNVHSSNPFEFEFNYSAVVGCTAPLNDDVDTVSYEYARVVWTSPNAPSQFGLEYGPAGFDVGTGTVVTGAVDQAIASAELTNLESNTLYQYYLWEECNGAPSDSVSGFFRTEEPCPIPGRFAFNVSDVDETSATIAWNALNPGSTYYIGYSPSPLDVENMTVVSGIAGTDGPPVELTGLNPNTDYSYAYWEKCEFGDSDTTFPFGFTTLAWCDNPLFFAAGETSGNSAVFNWVSQNGSGTYYIEYGIQGFELGQGTVVSGAVGTQPVTVTGLNPNTVYDAYLWEVCDNDFASDTVGPEVFSTFVGAPENDNCADAEAVTCGMTYATNSDFATAADTPETECFLIADGPGVWYSYAGNDQAVTLSLCGSDFDTQILVFAGSCEAYECVVGNDDFSGCPDYQSQATFNAIAGTDYLIFVGGYEGETGNLVMEVSCSEICSPVPGNDECDAAVALTIEGPDCEGETFTTHCATPSGFSNECNPFLTPADVWFSFNSGASGSFNLFIDSLTSGMGELALAVYTACDQNSFVGCSDNLELGANNAVELEPNTDYFMQVWTEMGATGDFVLCLRDADNSISELAVGNLKVYPNPTSGLVHFDTSLPLDVVVLDGTGRMVLQERVVNGQLDLSELTKGLYLIQVDGFAATRIILE